MSEEKTLKATHRGELKIGNAVLDAAVLEDGTRVLSRAGFIRAIGRKGKAKGGRQYDAEFKVPVFLTASNLKPFITEDLDKNSEPLLYKPITRAGRLASGRPIYGYRANFLPQVCGVFLDAKDAGVLLPNQEHIAEQCKILLRGFATVGITALVDEATGYQEVRDRQALQAILDKFLRKEFAAWAKRFPDEFYEQMFRLRGWQWRGMRVNRPSVVGNYTKDLVYQRLAPGILEELERKNPKDDKGYRKSKHHQWLTEDIGHPALSQHLHATMALMRSATTWDQFYRAMQRAFPKQNTTMLLDFPEEPEESASAS
jgi:P63C domain-containing protein